MRYSAHHHTEPLTERRFLLLSVWQTMSKADAEAEASAKGERVNRAERESDVAARAELWLADVVAEVAKQGPVEGEQNVLCVSHGGCIAVFLDDVCQLAGLEAILPIKNTSVTVLDITPHRGGWKGGWSCTPGKFVNDTTHLDDESIGSGPGDAETAARRR